jgi:hypothetical protein
MIRRLLIFLLLIPMATKAQEKLPKWGIKTSPQHLIVNTIRFEVERVLSDQEVSLTVAPYIVWGDLWEDHPNDDIAGVGGEISGRAYFVNAKKNMNGLYASYGFNYTYYNITSRNRDWKTSVEDGLEIIRYDFVKKPVEIHKVGVVLTMGYQFNIKNLIIIDLYTGMGLKKSFSPQGDDVLERYDGHIFDLAHGGLDPRIGYKIGFVLR